VLPVTLTSGMRRSSTIRSPISASPPIARHITPGTPCFSSTLAAIFVAAIAQSGVFGDGFHKIESPHSAPIIAFHDHTATGKLKAVITPTGPSGSHCSYSL
jgi:hypothetical protein